MRCRGVTLPAQIDLDTFFGVEEESEKVAQIACWARGEFGQCPIEKVFLEGLPIGMLSMRCFCGSFFYGWGREFQPQSIIIVI